MHAAAYNSPMPRTYSLARLLLIIALITITLIAIASGVVVDFPGYAFIWLVLSPTGIIYLTLVNLARQRSRVRIASIVGMFVGSSFASGGDVIVSTPLGALLFGGAALLADFIMRRNHPPPAPDPPAPSLSPLTTPATSP
jgi:hypothetical protein